MDHKLRVALGTVYPYDESRILGGVEAVAHGLVPALACVPDLEVHVVSCNCTIKRSILEQRGKVIFHWLATGRGLNSLRAATINAWRVRRVYEQIKPDIVHAQGFSEYAIAAPTNIPLVLTPHGFDLFAPAMRNVVHFRGPVGLYRRWVGEWLTKRSVRNAQAVISIGGDYVPRVMGRLLDGKSVYHIANPIAMDIWEAVPSGQDSGYQVLCVGEIIERKNAVGLVQAFAEVVHRLPEARLHFAGGIGEPGYFTRAQDEVKRLGLQSNVTFLGRLDQSQLLEAHARSSLVALASIQETAPMALAQAMAAGKPVVATRVGGIPWMVEDGVTGCLVEVGDTEALAARMAELLNDEPKRASMGSAGRARAVQLFRADLVAEQTARAYRGLLERV
jgi:glycosyltransferase involved in cell wall biosynthesis